MRPPPFSPWDSSPLHANSEMPSSARFIDYGARERLATLEERSRGQDQIIDWQHSRLTKLEQAQRRGEEMARLKAARKAARRDLIKTAQWLVAILLQAAYIGYLLVTGQHEALLRALGLGG